MICNLNFICQYLRWSLLPNNYLYHEILEKKLLIKKFHGQYRGMAKGISGRTWPFRHVVKLYSHHSDAFSRVSILIRHLGESLSPSSSPFHEPQKLLDILQSHTVNGVLHFPGWPKHFPAALNHIDLGLNAFLHRRNRYAIARRHAPLHTNHKTDGYLASLKCANSSLFDTSSYYFLSQFTYCTSRCQVIISLLFTCCILDIIVLFAEFIDMHNQTDICPAKIRYIENGANSGNTW